MSWLQVNSAVGSHPLESPPLLAFGLLNLLARPFVHRSFIVPIALRLWGSGQHCMLSIAPSKSTFCDMKVIFLTSSGLGWFTLKARIQSCGVSPHVKPWDLLASLCGLGWTGRKPHHTSANTMCCEVFFAENVIVNNRIYAKSSTRPIRSTSSPHRPSIFGRSWFYSEAPWVESSKSANPLTTEDKISGWFISYGIT